MLLAPLVDAADPVKPGLDRPQDRAEERALAIEDAPHVPAERFHQRDDDGAVQNDLNPANGGHGRVPSVNAGSMCDAVRTARAAAGRRSGKTAGRRRRWRRANNQRSWRSPQKRFRAKACPALDAGWVPVRVKKTRQNLKSFAGVGVSDRHPEEAEAEAKNDDVQPEVLLCVVTRGPAGRPSRFRWLLRCPPAHRFSRRKP